MTANVVTLPPDTADAIAGLSVSGLTIGTRHGNTLIVEDVSFNVRRGEILGLVGESGSGKSTIGVGLLGLARRGLRISAGSIRIGELDIAALSERQLRDVRGRVVAYVPQDPASGLNPAMRVGTQLAEILRIHPGVLAVGETRDGRLRQVLEEVGLRDIERVLDSYPHQLSGGQQQRVGIAMAIIARPQLVVFDEPTTGLDVTTQKRVIQTIRELTANYEMMSVYVSHDLAVVADLADRTAVLYAGRLVELSDTSTIFKAGRHPYTIGLIGAVPSMARPETLVGITGRPPRPGAWPLGCSFAPRCAHASDICREALPALAEITTSHLVSCHHADLTVHEQAVGTPVPATAGQDGSSMKLRNLSAYYGDVKVLHDISFDVPRGECVAIVGESGSGKTTLSRCLAGLHSNWSGEVSYEGVPLEPEHRKRPRNQIQEIQYVFQNPYGSLNPKMTVGANMEEPLRSFTKLGHGDRWQVVLETLNAVALSDRYANLMPDQLSGGERQRVAVGRSLTVSPKLLICDEVTSALDVSVQALLIEQLRELQLNRTLSMLFVTHNLAVVRSIAQRVVVLSEGRIVEQGPVDQVLTDPQHPYTRQLLLDVPDIKHQR